MLKKNCQEILNIICKLEGLPYGTFTFNIGNQKCFQVALFSFYMQTYVVDTHWKCLNETLLKISITVHVFVEK